MLTGAVLLIVGLAAALSVDVVRGGYGVKSDEATYVSMTLSLVRDGNLTYERRDLERFFALYRQGPEGIFLKKGKRLDIGLVGRFPFVRVENDVPDARTDRLYYGKALVYPVMAAPLVWLFGLNGFLVLHVLLLVAALACGYWFLAARSHRAAALIFTLAFVGASVVPVYAVFLMPEVFNFSLAFVAYFLFLYKEEVGSARFHGRRGWVTDVAAAILLGVVTYSKPTNVLLIAPLVLLHLGRRQIRSSVAIGLVFGAVTGGLFLANAIVTGEFNYQGGDRAQFYTRGPGVGSFPFDGRLPDAWDVRQAVTTNDADTAAVLDPSRFARRLADNLTYFAIGRHFGFIPYFFPGAVALVAWLLSRERFVPWRILTAASFAGSALLLLVFLPYTWSGGGGPAGNRYLLSLYPAVFFLMPPLGRSGPALLAWVGGALFTAKLVVNPFVAAKFTWQSVERGFARRLPVELTMANDLPIRLDGSRSPIPYGHDPDVLLYFLDQHAYPPEPPGMWVAASGRADILLRTDKPLDHLVVEAESPVRTVVTISLGREAVSATLDPGRMVTFTVPAAGKQDVVAWAYLMTVQSSEGFIPRLLDPASQDSRNLGALIRFRGVLLGRDARP
jgi:hypothetical protein